MIWEILALAVVLAFAGAGAISTLRGRADQLLLQAIFALALGGFNVYAFGTVWFPIKIVASWALLLFAWRLLMNRHTEPLSAWWFATWWLLSFWVVMAGLLAFVVDAPLADDLGGGLRSSALRPIVQIHTYLSMMALTPLAMMALRSEADLCRFWTTYAIAAAASCAVALVQWLMLRAGIPFMPILRMTGRHSEIAAFSDAGSAVYRLYAFAGEPKQLAAFLLPITLAAALATLQPRAVRPWWAHPAVPAAFALVTILTYSSAALIALPLGAFLLLILMPRTGARGERILAVVSLSIICVPMLVIVLTMSNVELHILDLIHHRTVERLETEISERRETVALTYLFMERPELGLTGLGLGMFIFHVPGLLWGEGTEMIDSGWVTCLVDLGLLGTALLFVFCASAVANGAQAAPRLPPSYRLYTAGAMAALIGAAAMHLGWGVFGLLTLFVGVLRATTAPRPVASRVIPPHRHKTRGPQPLAHHRTF